MSTQLVKILINWQRHAHDNTVAAVVNMTVNMIFEVLLDCDYTFSSYVRI